MSATAYANANANANGVYAPQTESTFMFPSPSAPVSHSLSEVSRVSGVSSSTRTPVSFVIPSSTKKVIGQPHPSFGDYESPHEVNGPMCWRQYTPQHARTNELLERMMQENEAYKAYTANKTGR